MTDAEDTRLAHSKPASEGLREALEPFANVRVPNHLRRHGIEVLDDDRFVTVEMPFSPHEQKVDEHGGKTLGLCLSLDGLTIGDFRRAAAALQPLTEPQRLGQEGEDVKLVRAYRLRKFGGLSDAEVERLVGAAGRLADAIAAPTPAQAEPVAKEVIEDQIQALASVYTFSSLGDRDRAVACMQGIARFLYTHPPAPPQDREAVARCIAIAREVRDGFLSPDYATDQPVSSFSERFACDQVASAIENEFAMGTAEQRALLGAEEREES